MTIFKQWQQVADGTKTATCRMHIIPVGSIQAVIPKMFNPGVWWKPETGEVIASIYDKANEIAWDETGFIYDLKAAKLLVGYCGYTPLKVRILSVRPVHVQDLTEEDCVAEGIIYSKNMDGYYCPHLKVGDALLSFFDTARDCYAALWNSINKAPKRVRFENNPAAFYHRFEVVK